MKISQISPDELHAYETNARIHGEQQIAEIARSISAFGFNNPILIDKDKCIIAGHGRALAAKQLGLPTVPVVCLDHLTPRQKKAYILADNKLAEKSSWDRGLLKSELQSLFDLETDIDLTITGFSTPELDLLFADTETALQKSEIVSDIQPEPRVRSGDLWRLGDHYLFCGNSLKKESFSALMQGELAEMVFTDPPYNVPIQGHVSGKGAIKHREFAFASGEMSETEFTAFLSQAFSHLKDFSKNGSLHFICMDWRHIREILNAGNSNYEELKNLCVWNKQLAGMGSLYRSQHELVFVFKNGISPHKNNVQLGKHGRNRTNVWDYPGVHVSNCHKKSLSYHPTVKPVSMIADAIVDCTNIGDTVLDCFAGSGSTLLAAERVKRKAYVMEYDPTYCDVILDRFSQSSSSTIELVSHHD